MNNLLSNTNYNSVSKLDLTSALVKANKDKELTIKYAPSMEGFTDFVFFGSAKNIVSFAINKIVATYPINITNTSYYNITNAQYETYLKYLNTYSKFERSVLSGFTESVTGTYNNNQFTIPNIRRNGSTLSNIDDENYIQSLLLQGEMYDAENNQMLQKFVPFAMMEYDENDYLKTLLNMFGQIFDEIKTYTDHFDDLFNTGYSIEKRANTFDIKNILSLLGFKVHTNYLFSNLINYLVDNDISFSEKAIQTEIWERILTNLIYIYKSKGTLESLKAFMNVLGINSTMVDINEYVNFTTPKYIDVNNVVNYLTLLSRDDTYITSNSQILNLLYSSWTIVYNFIPKYTEKNHTLFACDGVYECSLIDSSYLDDYKQLIKQGFIRFKFQNSSNAWTTIDTENCLDIYADSIKNLIIVSNNNVCTLYLTYKDTLGQMKVITASGDISDLKTAGTVNFHLLNNISNSKEDSFVGEAVNFKIFKSGFDESLIEYYSNSINSVNLVKEEFSQDTMISWEFNEPYSSEFRQNNFENANKINKVYDNSSNAIDGDLSYDNEVIYLSRSEIVPIKRYVSGLTQLNDKINIGKPFYENTNYLSITISTSKALNENFEYSLGAIDVFDFFDESDFNLDSNKYAGLERLRKIFENSVLDVKSFDQFLSDVESFGIGLFKGFYQFLPATANLLYMGILIESPIYDRNKHIIRNLEQTPIRAGNQLEDITTDFDAEVIPESECDIFSLNEIDAIPIEVNEAELNDITTSGDIEEVLDIEINEDDNGTLLSDSIIKSNFLNVPKDFNTDMLRNGENIITYDETSLANVYPLYTKSEFSNLILDGKDTFYYDPIANSFNDISLTLNCFDKANDNIIGSKISIKQGTDSQSPKMIVINTDNNLLTTKKSNDFFITNYSGINLQFKYLNNNSRNLSDEAYSCFVSSDNKETEVIFKIKWVIDKKIVGSTIFIDDSINILNYPCINWNLTPDVGSVTATYSEFGYTTNPLYSTTADFVAGKGLNIYFKNSSESADAELNFDYSITGQSNLFTLLDGEDSANSSNLMSRVGAIDTESLIYLGNTNTAKTVSIKPNEIRKFKLMFLGSVSALTANTYGSISFRTNQPISQTTNKVFKLNFSAIKDVYFIEPYVASSIYSPSASAPIVESGTRKYNVNLTSQINGIATEFTTPDNFISNSLAVTLNGQRLGITDFDVTHGNSFMLTGSVSTPISGDTLFVDYDLG